MALRVTIDLDDKDLKHFQLIMSQARSAAARIAPEEIVAGAEQLIREISEAGAPAFVDERLGLLRSMIDMLSDVDWRLPAADAERVLNALTYFAEPEDLIPDDIPGLGFLDDAIMIELVARELQPEIQAYRDFCEFRTAQKAKDSSKDASREDWLAARRAELQNRMHSNRLGRPSKFAKRLFGKADA